MEKNCSTCKWAGWDPDGNYCIAPEILKQYPYGLNIPQRSTPTWIFGVEDYCEPDNFKLYETKETK